MELVEGTVNKTTPLFQFDYGQRLFFTGAELPMAYEVHFCNVGSNESITALGDSDGVRIPDELLLNGKHIKVWIYLHSGEDDGETEFNGIVPVYKRAKPTNNSPSPTQQDIITQAIAVLNDAIEESGENVRHYPIIEDDYWFVWDAEQGHYVSTGVRATGDKGDPGEKGDPGDLSQSDIATAMETQSMIDEYYGGE